MNYFWLIITLLITTLKFQLGVYAITGKKTGHYAVIYGLNAVLFFICLFSNNIFFREIYLLEYAMLFITYLIILKIPVYERFLSLFVAGFFLIGISICVQDVFALIGSNSLFGYSFSESRFLIRSAVIVAIFVIIIVVRSVTVTFMKINFEKSLFRLQIIALFIGFITLSVILQQRYLFLLLGDETEKKIAFTGSFCTILCVMFLIIFFIYLRRMNEQTTFLMRTQENYYKNLLSYEEETRRFRHDIKNHLVVLENMVSVGNNDELKKYIHSMNTELSPQRSRIYPIGNPVLEALTGFYLSSLPQSVNVSITGLVPENINLPKTSLCRIYGNLLENAVEAVISDNYSDPKFIHIRFETDSGFLIIKSENSYYVKENLTLGKKRFTSKEDKSLHGYGLINIKDEIKRNKGIFTINKNDGCFTISVALPLSTG